MAGPCAWDITFNDCCECWDALTPAARERAVNYATTVLWAATGKQYGACPQVVRPCGRSCGNSDFAGWYWSNGVFVPYILNGVWRNCYGGCAGLGCSCAPHCQVYLPGMVTAVSEVVVDGFLVDPADWRVDDGKWLVRTDGDCWPYCQDFNVDAGLGVFNDNTMQVTYTQGGEVPAALLDAAATLACEFAKACMNQPCRLTGRLSTVARQGVQLTFQNVDELIRLNLTGIPEVDQIIRAFNPAGLQRPLRVSSPDLPTQRVVTIP